MKNAARAAVGIDLGGTNIKVALVNPMGRVLKKIVRDTDASLGSETVIEHMVAAVRRLLNETATDSADLAGVGVGAPGPLSPSRGRIFQTPNLPGWRDVPLRDRLERALTCRVLLDNDGNAAAYGEFWAGKGNGVGDLVMLTLGTGVGTGVVMDGRILHGHFENAAEVGHTIVVPDGLPCPCGQRGCLEQYASASGVARLVVQAMKSGEKSVLQKQIRSDRQVTTEQIVDAVTHGDALCLRVWNDACRFLAIAAINIQHTYNPARLLLGGGMSQAGNLLLDGVKRYVQANRWSVHDDLPAISLATLGYDAGVIGAAGLVWKAVQPHGSS